MPKKYQRRQSTVVAEQFTAQMGADILAKIAAGTSIAPFHVPDGGGFYLDCPNGMRQLRFGDYLICDGSGAYADAYDGALFGTCYEPMPTTPRVSVPPPVPQK